MLYPLSQYDVHFIFLPLLYFPPFSPLFSLESGRCPGDPRTVCVLVLSRSDWLVPAKVHVLPGQGDGEEWQGDGEGDGEDGDGEGDDEGL